MTDIDLQCDAGNVAVNVIEALNQHAKKLGVELNIGNYTSHNKLGILLFT